MNLSVNVAVCADKNIEVALHVTLYSLMDSAKENIKIYFIHKGYTQNDLDAIHSTLNSFKNHYQLIPIEFDDQVFHDFRGLHGNKFAFTRIMLPEIIKEDKIVYLDSDLVIKLNVAEIFHENLNGYCLGASGIENIKHSLEHELFVSLGLSPDAPYFNSGILLLDLETWRHQNLTAKCLKFAQEHAKELLTADQTILNYIFYKDFMIMKEKYNIALYPSVPPISLNETNKIFHFVGSPKPWDLFGEYIHKNHHIFQAVLEKTYHQNFKSYNHIDMKKIKRTLRLSRTYYQCLTKR